MRIHFLSLDTSHINYVKKKRSKCPVKINTTVKLDGNEFEDEEVTKNIFEFTEEDEKEGHKDKKVMNILFNGIDADMFDNIINLHYN